MRLRPPPRRGPARYMPGSATVEPIDGGGVRARWRETHAVTTETRDDDGWCAPFVAADVVLREGTYYGREVSPAYALPDEVRRLVNAALEDQERQHRQAAQARKGSQDD